MVNPTQFDDARLFAPPPQRADQGELGQEDFLTLMITQFRNQDPFKPMDNGAELSMTPTSRTPDTPDWLPAPTIAYRVEISG